MPIKSPFSEVILDVDAGASPLADPSTAVLEPDAAMRILVLGDFSGRTAPASKSSRLWKPVEIDRDNFEEVLAAIGPECAGMRFAELDDFHPDAIYRKSNLFQALRGLRRKLEDPSTFAEAAAEIRAWNAEQTQPAATPQETAPPQSQRAPLPEPGSGMSLLDSMVEAAEPAALPPLTRRGDLQGFVERVVAPHTVPAEHKDLPRLRGLVDTEAGSRLRAILHDPGFQSLEAAWRAMFRLVRAVETGSQLKVYLLDISKTELAKDLGAADLRQSQLWRILVDEALQTAEDPWGVVAGNYSFAQTEDDARMLGRLAKIMSFAGAPFLAEADPAAGTGAADEGTRQWERLRHAAEACWIGLAMPRFLLRLPYGKDTDPVECFTFEEMPTAPRHQQYLWGNPAFACVQLIAEAFADDGWEMRPGTIAEIDRLPLHVYEADGEKQLKPCAEVLLTDNDIEWILDQGYMPLATRKGTDTARLMRFQSIARPLARLSGRWG